MKITAIYGTNHIGSTVLLARELIHALPHQPDDITEFFLPRDFNHFCSGCGACFVAKKPLCQQTGEQLHPILAAISQADLIILASPVYVYHVTGAMKSFLDHFGCRWIIHRPDGTLTRKTAVLLTTAAGSGIRQALRDMRDSMNWWGVGRVQTYGIRSMALTPSGLTPKVKQKMAHDMQRLARKLRPAPVTPRTGIRVRYWLSRKIGGGLQKADHEYWSLQGWLHGDLPWKKQKDG